MLVFSAMGLYPLLFYQPLSAGIAVSFYISTSINLYRPLRGHFLRSRRKPSVTGKAQGESIRVMHFKFNKGFIVKHFFLSI